jgi:uncharacterized Tic20 family protein
MTDKNWALLAHLGTLLGYVIGFGNFIIPLIIWLTKRDESDLISQHAKESLNFQLSVFIYVIVAALLSIVLIGIPILFGLIITDIVCVIIASMKADRGEFYRYPMTIRFVK